MAPGNRVSQYDSSVSVAMTVCSGWISICLSEHSCTILCLCYFKSSKASSWSRREFCRDVQTAIVTAVVSCYVLVQFLRNPCSYTMFVEPRVAAFCWLAAVEFDSL